VRHKGHNNLPNPLSSFLVIAVCALQLPAPQETLGQGVVEEPGTRLQLSLNFSLRLSTASQCAGRLCLGLNGGWHGDVAILPGVRGAVLTAWTMKERAATPFLPAR